MEVNHLTASPVTAGRQAERAGVPALQSGMGACRRGAARTEHRGGTESGWGTKPQHLQVPVGLCRISSPPHCFLQCSKSPCKLAEALSPADRTGAPRLCSFSAELRVSNDGHFSYADFPPPQG